MLKKSVISFLLFFQTFCIYATNYTISGYITDQKTGETLISASLFDKISQKGAVSNNFGYYSLTIPSGEVDLQYSYVGYQKESRKFILNKDTVIHIRMNSSIELKEVTVTGENQRESGVHGSQIGAVEIPVSLIKSIPALFGETDVLKALQLLPGVKAGTEGSAGLYIRGGGPDENLLLLDGIPVYNVNHMFGFFSVFNADAIKNVTLYKGNFPARFGGRLSSVVDIRMNDGNDKEFHGNASIGLISSKINLEGPIIKEKTTFNLSFRRTYADVLTQPLIRTISKQNGNTGNSSAGYYFYDLNAKISHKISNNDRLFLSFYSGDDVIYANIVDKYSYDSNINQTSKLKMDWSWGNLISALKWNHVLSSKLFLNTTAAYTRYRFNMGIGTSNDQKILDPPSQTSDNISLGYRSGIEDYSVKADLDYTPGSGHDVKFGGSFTNHTFRPGVSVAKMSSTGQGNVSQMDTTIGDKNVYSNETMLYAEDNISLGTFIKANIGLHYSTFIVQNQFYNSLQPRLSMRFLISDKLSFKAGYASMSQYIHLLSNSSISLPTDLWVPVTKRITPMKSKQVSAGFYYNLLDKIDLSVEGYYKSMDNLIEYRDGASFLGSGTGWEDKVYMGRGWAYGIEFLAQRSFGKTTGWLGYTWSKSERLFDRPGQEINFGEVFPAKYDRRHDVSLTMTHKFSERFDLSGTWVFSTGNCGTLALQDYKGNVTPGKNDSGADQNGTPLAYISSRNNYRLNPYHRMDIGVNFHKQLKHGIRTWNLSVYNAYNQLNPFMVYPTTKGTYNEATQTYTERKTLTQISIFPLIPSISYNYKF